MQPTRLDYPEAHNGYISLFTGYERKLHPHRHLELECNVCTAGGAEYLAGGSRYALKPGTVLWLFPQQTHVLSRWSKDCSFWIMVFNHRVLSESVEKEHPLWPGSAPSGPFDGYCRTLSFDKMAWLDRTILQIVEAGKMDDPGLYNAGLKMLLLLLWRMYLDADDRRTGQAVHPAVYKAMNLIEKADDPASMGLAELASEIGISVSRFSEVFKQDTGMGFLDYRNRLLLERFHLILSGDVKKSISEAACDAGFTSYSQFYRAYKKVFGRPPSLPD